MSQLNRDASVVFARAGANALTDVTGFGLLGHLRNLAAASGVAAVVANDLVPILTPAREYVRLGIAPGGTHANRRFLSNWVSYDADIDELEQLLLCDAQTSGGLLAALAADEARAAVAELRSLGMPSAAVIGSIVAGEPGRIQVSRAGHDAYAQSRKTT